MVGKHCLHLQVRIDSRNVYNPLECTFSVLLSLKERGRERERRENGRSSEGKLRFYMRKTYGRIPISKVSKQYQLVILVKTSLGSGVCNVTRSRIS